MIWKSIEGYEGLYEVSDTGDVKSINRIAYRTNGRALPLRTRIRRPSSVSGYNRVFLYKDGIRKSFLNHRLAAMSFIPNTENKPFINHKDGNKMNNHISNLEWCTPQENIQHAFRTGLAVRNAGYGNPTNKEVMQVNKDGNLIKTFYSIAEASSITGIHAGDIGRCANGFLKSAGGYKWATVKSNQTTTL